MISGTVWTEATPTAEEVRKHPYWWFKGKTAVKCPDSGYGMSPGTDLGIILGEWTTNGGDRVAMATGDCSYYADELDGLWARAELPSTDTPDKVRVLIEALRIFLIEYKHDGYWLRAACAARNAFAIVGEKLP